MNGTPDKLTKDDSVSGNADAGVTIPGYQIKRQLGRGGMAFVYLAIQESFGREVALKVLAPDNSRDKEFSQRFLREARIISQLAHPNIVTVYDVGIHEGYHYLSMEYICGEDLQQAGSSLSKRQVINIIRDVAKALEYAHQNGYIHRDVKPENIMLHEDGRVLLMDFGIARGSDSTLGMTKTGRAIGTPYYMSPEQTKGQPVDHRSDIYSLGVVLYQMLTGYVPYDADSAIAVGIKHVSEPIPQLPDSLRFLQPIINTCMSKNPAHRYQHASDLIHVLEAIPDDMLNAAEAQAAAFRELGRDHNAETLLGDEPLTTSSIPKVRIPTEERKAVSATQLPQVESPPPRKRRALLFLLLLVCLAWLGFLKQEQLMGIWHNQVQPYLAQHNLLPASILARVSPSPAVTSSPTEAGNDEVAAVEQSPLAAQEPESNKVAPVLSLPEQAQQYWAELDEQPQKAIELAVLYRQLLTQQPGNPQARQGLADLRAWYIENIRDAFTNQDLAQARLLVNQLQESFPRINTNEKFQRLEERLNQAETIQAHILKANEYQEAGALIQPEGQNALAEFQAALALAQDNTEAQLGIEIITHTILSNAKEEQLKGNIEQALAITSQALEVIGDSPDLLALQKELQENKQRQEAIASHLSEAEKQFRTGKLVSPKGKSAYDHYHAVLKQDPNNAAAKTGLDKIERQLINKVNFNIHNRTFEQAKRNLATVHQYFGNSKAYHRTKQQLALAIEESRPKVQHLVFSETQITSLDIPQAYKLQLGRTLYIGFDYQNFEGKTTLLHAVLMDGTGRVQIAQKPVIITGAAGEHYFDIDLPVEGFMDGSYILQLKLDNQKLISDSFVAFK